jgi:hypothetical protein
LVVDVPDVPPAWFPPLAADVADIAPAAFTLFLPLAPGALDTSAVPWPLLPPQAEAAKNTRDVSASSGHRCNVRMSKPPRTDPLAA